MAIATAARATWPTDVEAEWREIDEALRTNALQRSGLDAHEMHWLREAERVQIWKPLGMVSMLDYMDRVLGHNPETARKRLRVARALADLPEIFAALARGELTFSAVRELTRVATRVTEQAWCEAVRDKSSREIEDLVNGRRPGDLPEDPPDPDLRTHAVRFVVSASTYARLRETRIHLDEEHGTSLDEDQLLATLCERALENRGGTTDGRARAQIAFTVCERCDQGWQTGGGVRIAVDAATVERARCDAQYIGSIDGAYPERAHQDIPPSVVRFIWARDHGRCQTPGCRSARGLEIHHIIRRVDGGSHEPENLTLRCSACHAAHHAGLITIRGSASAQIVTTRNVNARPAVPHRRPSAAAVLAPPANRVRAQAIEALTALGWKRGLAVAAVDDALGHVAREAPIAELIRQALLRCPRPTLES